MNELSTGFVGLDAHAESTAIGFAEAGREAPRFVDSRVTSTSSRCGACRDSSAVRVRAATRMPRGAWSNNSNAADASRAITADPAQSPQGSVNVNALTAAREHVTAPVWHSTSSSMCAVCYVERDTRHGSRGGGGSEVSVRGTGQGREVGLECMPVPIRQIRPERHPPGASGGGQTIADLVDQGPCAAIRDRANSARHAVLESRGPDPKRRLSGRQPRVRRRTRTTKP